MNRKARVLGKHGVAVIFSTKDAALSRALQLNMEEGRIKRHEFEAAPIQEGKRVARCKHCGLPVKHARAHP